MSDEKKYFFNCYHINFWYNVQQGLPRLDYRIYPVFSVHLIIFSHTFMNLKFSFSLTALFN